MSRKILFKKKGIGIKMKERVYDIPSFNGIFEDIFFLQNIPSMVVSLVLAPKENDKVLDLCASPGGKTTHIAMLMKNKGKIIAIDRSEEKVNQIRNLCKQLGITCIEVLKYDSTKLVKSASNFNQDFNPIFEEESFDKILLDPSCSGIGRRPVLKIHQSFVQFNSFRSYQKLLMSNAVPLLKAGGVLVYSTCTINPQENEEVVRFALDNYPLKLSPQSPFLGEPGLYWRNNLGKGLTEEESKLCQRFFPDKENQVGFFIAKFVKEEMAKK